MDGSLARLPRTSQVTRPSTHPINRLEWHLFDNELLRRVGGQVGRAYVGGALHRFDGVAAERQG